jgi:hypothetical protein
MGHKGITMGTTFILRNIAFVAVVIGLINGEVRAQSDLYTDSFGYTRGTIGNDSVNLHDDAFGYTRGTIGNDSVNLHEDAFGYTRGTIGNDSVNLHTDSFGYTRGTIGDRSVNCHLQRVPVIVDHSLHA